MTVHLPGVTPPQGATVAVRIGKVGEILVDATTGELLVEKDTVHRLSEGF